MKALIFLALFAGQILTGTYRKMGTAVIINTTFNEGIVGTAITGTSPAINVHGNLWANWPTISSLLFSVSGAQNPVNSSIGNSLDTGAPVYTVTFSGLTNTATQLVAFSCASAALNDRMEVWTLGTGGIALKETVAGVITTIQTQPVADGATGSIVAIVNGTSIEVTAFGQPPMFYTIPGGHGNINGQFIAMLSTTVGYVFPAVKVTVP